MPIITLSLLDTYLPVVFTLNMISGYNKEWKLVSEVGEIEFYINYLSHAIVRTVLAMTFCIFFRHLLSKHLRSEKTFQILAVATDIVSYAIAQVFPTSLILALIMLLSYAIIACRFIYDVFITGHSLGWLFYQTRCFVRKCEIEERREKALKQNNLSDSNLSDVSQF